MMTRTILVILILAMPGWAAGSDILTQKNPLYPYQSSIYFQDDFMFGSSNSGSIGSLGWNAAGTISGIVPITGRPGVIRLDTSTVSGTTTRLNMFGSGQYVLSMSPKVLWVIRLNTNDANTTVRLGNSSNWAGGATEGAYFEKLDGDTNWFCVTRTTSVETRTNSGVAVNTSFNNYLIQATTSSVIFYINNVNVCTNTTNLPSADYLGTGIHIVNSAAASKTLDIDYVEMQMTGLVR